MSTSTRRPRSEPAPRRTSQGRSRGRPADRGENSYRTARLAQSRYGIVYDIDGPKVRLGVVWFVVVLVSIRLGLGALTALVAAIAALAAAQTAQALRTKWRRPDLATAALVAALVPVAAAFGTGLAGLIVILGAIGAVATAGARSGRRRDPVIDGSAVVRAAVFVGLAAASLVMLYRFDIGAVVTVVLIASAYEVGDYLVGSGASNLVEGPLAGFVAALVVTGVLAVVQPPPFQSAGLWLYALATVVSIPLGQVLASAILPRAGAPAPALRRLDSYLLAGPIWLALLWTGIGI